MATSRAYAIFLIVGMLISGTLATVVRKITFLMTAPGLQGDVHTFSKPWFGTEEMFLGELLVLPCFLVSVWLSIRRARAAIQGNTEKTGLVAPHKGEILPETELLASMSLGKAIRTDPSVKHLWVFIGTSMCDLAGTTLAGIGLLFIPASVYQILRGSIIMFTAIFGRLILKKKIPAIKITGICVVFVGLVMVGISAFLASESDDDSSGTSSTSLIIVGFVLIVAGQACNGLQFAIQELLIERRQVRALSIVGWEGMFGTVAMSFIVLPILQAIPGPDEGSQENTLDTLAMFRNDTVLLVLNMIAYPIIIAGLNGFALLITEEMSALYRCLIDASRVLLVWLVDLGIYYSGAKTYGEQWSPYSYLQLAGFVVFAFGMAVYRELVPFCNRLCEQHHHHHHHRLLQVQDEDPSETKKLVAAAAAAAATAAPEHSWQSKARSSEHS